MAWFWLILGGLFEVGFTTSLRFVDGFRNVPWTLAFLASVEALEGGAARGAGAGQSLAGHPGWAHRASRPLAAPRACSPRPAGLIRLLDDGRKRPRRRRLPRPLLRHVRRWLEGQYRVQIEPVPRGN